MGPESRVGGLKKERATIGGRRDRLPERCSENRFRGLARPHPVPLPQERVNNGQCLAFFIADGGLPAHDACAEYRLRPFADQKRLANASAPTYFPNMGSRMSHALVDCINAAQDRLIASELGRNRRALRIARGNLRRWMARDGSKVRPAFREWTASLTDGPLLKSPAS